MKVYSATKMHKGTKRQVSTIVWILILIMMFIPLSAVAAETSSEKKTTLVFIIDSNTYTANGELIVMDVSPQIIEGRTMLPIRYAAEPLGADIGWDNATKKVTVSLGETNMELWIGQRNAFVDGKSVPIDTENPNVKPLIIKDRTMLPLRFVAENLGCEVQWDSATRKVTITRTGSGGASTTPGQIIIPPLEIKPPIEIKPPVLGIKPELLDKIILSKDISKLATTWGKEQKGKSYKVAMNEADIPVVMRIGRGYDVFGKYASVDSLKQSVLDTTKLIQDQKMERIRFDQGENTQIASESIRTYSNSMSTKIGASGSIFGFGGSVNTNFDQTRTEKLNNYFSTYSYIVKKYGVYITGTTNLKNYLIPEAKSMINNSSIPATTVFNNFGHYILVDTITGGRVDYSITASSKASTSYENFKAAAKADFNVVIFKAGASAEYQNIKNKSSYDSNKLQTLRSYGGNFTLNLGQFLSDPQILSKWEATLENNGTLVEFGSTTAKALVPIWELCDNAIRANYLKTEFEKLNLAQGNQWPMDKYITDIVFVSNKNQASARASCPPGYILIDVDLNAGAGGNYIYLCYKLGENINQAYTDFFLQNLKNQNQVYTWLTTHNGNYANFSINAVDLNQGSGGEYIYLWNTKDKTLPPIKGIEVVFDSPNNGSADWNSVFWHNSQSAADVKKSVKGKNIYIKYTR